MSVKTRFVTVANGLFLVLLVLNAALPDVAQRDAEPAAFVGFLVAVEALVLVGCGLARKKSTLDVVKDVACFVYVLAGLWLVFTAKTDILSGSLFPAPGAVFAQLVADYDKVGINIASSLGIIVEGFALGAVCAIPLGLAFGWNLRVGHAASRVSSFFASIPPIVYIPYAIALLPTFRSASVFVIFMASFWPILINVMSGVLNVDQRIVDSARTMNVNTPTMLVRVIFPAALPQIFVGCNLALCFSFILLTSAEMIGASNGMGYYVKNYSDLGDYTRTVGGIIVIGAVISLVTYAFSRLEGWALRWKRS